MRAFGHQMIRRGRERRPSRLLATTTVLTSTVLGAGTLVGVLALTAGPAYADVTTSTYTIGSPSPAVTSVTASPSGATVVSPTNFEVSFTVNPSLSGSGSAWVSVVPSTPLGATPSNIALIGSSCVQSGTNGGAYSATGLTIDLGTSCSLSSGTKAEVDFNADAPASTGTFSFAVTTSNNSSPATSNTITVTTAGPVLTAATYAFGANTTYTIDNATVASLTASGTSLMLTAAATHGTEKIAFVNSGTGAGYSVTVMPSGGTASSDTVTNASASGPAVTLTLATALANGDAVTITSTGTSPAASATSQADDITVAPGNGTPETTNSIDFGGSVTALSVAPSSLVAGASATYSVGFTASDAVSAGGDIYLNEAAGPTNFTTVTGVEVIDTTQNWRFVATGAVLTNGAATVPLADSINVGDSVSLLIVGVTNPSSPGTIGDFSATTTGDPVSVDAPAYTIAANASPGVVVTVNPITTSVIATYTIANIRASATLSGGSGTIKLEAPAGTVFPNSPAFYSITDATNSGGSGTVTAALSGGGTNAVTFTVPNTVNSGDVITLTLADVLNPTTASASDSITIVGAVTGPQPSAATTTTTVPPTTTTTKPPVKKVQHPTIADPTSKADVSKAHLVHVELKCTVEACKGYITLTDVSTVVGSQHYSLGAGKKGIVVVHLRAKGILFLAGAAHHTIKVTATVTVTGGKTVKERTTLVA
jgi:large repetitive protein